MENELRNNFYGAMGKIVKFYEKHNSIKILTKKQIIKEAYLWRGLFDMELYVATEMDYYKDIKRILKDINYLFNTPIKTVADIVDKGQIIMEINESIKGFEFMYYSL